ncbi:DUF4926 domain-containing protein [Lysobacter sp. BMK333-48F3]|uniref:DUF4926 domain-containing protein n=1 Tax=Lysobacter sp. BMK333-48F3 TaxID=2867962 RepID=UPI001C8CC148|nr:DUF4926 domain-containing protein [Lysobacter sp. BMK333-48F3]MBX9404054.1 DUF4926 domain-containing protein [Lysobacter sp. BMK333-48F3]
MQAQIRDYDVVRLIADVPPERVDGSVGRRLPRVGDVGTVVMVHGSRPESEPAFCVEAVDLDGRTAWLAEVFASELEPVPSARGEA